MARTPNPVQKVKGFAQKAEDIQIGVQTIKVQKSFPNAKVEVFQYNDDDSVEVVAYRYNESGVRQNNNFVTADPTTALYELFLETGYYNLKFSGGGIPAPFKLPVKVESQTFNVHDFGARGDGVTDDTLAIQAAIDAMIAANLGAEGTGTLFFPSGRYLVNRRVADNNFLFDLPSGIVIQGTAGPYSGIGTSNCQIVLATEGVSIFRIRTNRHKIVIRDIGLTTSVSNNADTIAIDARETEENFENTYTSGIEFVNVTIWKFDRGISIEGSGERLQWDITGVRVNHCNIGECRYGVYINSQNCDFMKILDSRVGAGPGAFAIYMERVGIISIDSVLGAGTNDTSDPPKPLSDTFIYITAGHGTVNISGCECEGFKASIQVVPLNVGNEAWPILFLNCTWGPTVQLNSQCEIVSIANRYLPETLQCDPNVSAMIYSFGDSIIGLDKNPSPDYDFNLNGSNSRLVSRANHYRVDFQRPARFGGRAGQIADLLANTALAVAPFGATDAQMALCDLQGVPVWRLRADESDLYFENVAAGEAQMKLDRNGNLYLRREVFPNSDI